MYGGGDQTSTILLIFVDKFYSTVFLFRLANTVDGWNPVNSPVDMGNISIIYDGLFLHPRWLALGCDSINSITFTISRRKNQAPPEKREAHLLHLNKNRRAWEVHISCRRNIFWKRNLSKLILTTKRGHPVMKKNNSTPKKYHRDSLSRKCCASIIRTTNFTLKIWCLKISGLCCDPPKSSRSKSVSPSLFSRPLCLGNSESRSGQKLLPRLRFERLETYGTEPPAEPGGFGNKKMGVLASGVGEGREVVFCWILVDHGESKGGLYMKPHPLPPKRPEVKGRLSWGGVALGGGFPLDSDEWRDAPVIPYQCIFEDECPFFKVGYVISLPGMESSG